MATQEISSYDNVWTNICVGPTLVDVEVDLMFN
jgi:hypothetical protein